jgi:hypothetical protein
MDLINPALKKAQWRAPVKNENEYSATTKRREFLAQQTDC